MNRLRQRKNLRRVIGVLWLALVLGPWTALVHSVEHAHAAPAAEGLHDADHGWGHDAGSSACLSFDHLLTGQAPAGPPPALPCLAPAAARVAAPAPSIGPAAEWRAYEARGPPRA